MMTEREGRMRLIQTVDLGVIRRNVAAVRARTGVRVLVMVKADAYGHGMIEVARAIADEADMLGVATLEEGEELRKCAVKTPVLVAICPPGGLMRASAAGLTAAVADAETLRALAALPLSLRPAFHLKFDTGMHRLGFMTSELPELTAFLKSCKTVRVQSVYSHLAAAEDPESDDFTLGQIEMFRKNAGTVSEAVGYRPLYHILNSAGIERFSQWQFDMVRLGIGIYGISAIPGRNLAPVASFKCKILQIKHLGPEDGTIGYGRFGKIAPEGTVIATIPVGYADGVDRRLGNGAASFLLNGHRAPTIGNICMDMCMLDITGIDAEVGDTVTVFGEEPTATELAGILGTIPYEIFTSVPRRIERIIVKP